MFLSELHQSIIKKFIKHVTNTTAKCDSSVIQPIRQQYYKAAK